MAPPSPCTSEPITWPAHRHRIDDAAAILHRDIVDDLDIAESAHRP